MRIDDMHVPCSNVHALVCQYTHTALPNIGIAVYPIVLLAKSGVMRRGH